MCSRCTDLANDCESGNYYMKSIKLFVMDVDGTLTDGKIYVSANGEQFKAFDVKDGYGIRYILKEQGIKTAIITGRKSGIVQCRAKELDVDFIFQGVQDKVKCLEELLEQLGLGWTDVAYVGDDVNDLGCIRRAAWSGCPGDAYKSVCNAVTYVAKSEGGNGAVREIIECLVGMGDKTMIF